MSTYDPDSDYKQGKALYAACHKAEGGPESPIVFESLWTHMGKQQKVRLQKIATVFLAGQTPTGRVTKSDPDTQNVDDKRWEIFVEGKFMGAVYKRSEVAALVAARTTYPDVSGFLIAVQRGKHGVWGDTA